MSSINWSDEQKTAIETRGGNLLVSAAAGSGKTAVLVERIIRYLVQDDDPVDLDRLLVVTFTEAAAGEMRQRIGAALDRELQKRPDSTLLQRQILLLPRANIGTIHSFCSEVIRSHFYLLDLDPGFRVMDENEAFMLRSEVMEEVLEDLYDEHREDSPDAPFLYLVRSLAGTHGEDKEVIRLALDLYNFALSLPRPGAWLKKLPASLEHARGLPWEEQFWVAEWREMSRIEMDSWVESLEEARLLATAPGGPEKYESTLCRDLEKVREWRDLLDRSFAGLKTAMEKGRNWPALPRVARGEGQEDLKERVRQLRNGVKRRAGEYYSHYLSRSPEEMLADLKEATPVIRALVDLVLRFMESYRRIKMERAVLDFSDLEHLALAVLARNGEGSPWGERPSGDPEQDMLPSPVALKYQEEFTEVLVDEYQDVNGVQEAILRLVSRPGNRFLVGDVKQSVYRFRLADPTVFLDCYERFNDMNSGVRDPGRRLDLQSNFRSHPGVLRAVNYFFRRLMNRLVAEIDYDERARLNPGKLYPDPPGENNIHPVEFHLLEFGDPENGNTENEQKDRPDDGLEQEELDLIRFEARWIAGYIRKLVLEERSSVYDHTAGKFRPVRWRDIVVLMRSPRGRVGVFLEEFRRLGIPAYADGSGGYFAAPEVQTVLSLLQIIDNPHRDIPLAAVLRSPMVGLDACSLAKIRLAAPEGDFYTAVCRAAAGNADNGAIDTGLEQKLRHFVERLERWRDLARRLPPADLLEELYRRTGYYDVVGAIPGGAVRQANLRALVDRARKFEGTVYRGLFRFLRFIEQIQERGGDMDTARSLGESEDVVRVMSIHRSKGLEFPVVIVAGMGRGFNFRDLSRSYLWHRKLGCGPVITDLRRGIRYPTVLYRVIRHRLRLETLAEEMRLLYVAFTRAREKLVITAALRKLDRAVDAWKSRVAVVPEEGPLSASLLAGARGPLDWLGPAMWAHPALANAGYGKESFRAEGDSWQVILWPAPSLFFLRQELKTEEQWQKEAWADSIKRLEPVPGSIIKDLQADHGLVDADTLRRRLFWTYPHRELAGFPSKITVTEWRHREEEMEEEAGAEMPALSLTNLSDAAEKDISSGFDLPAFYTGRQYDGAERGRVVHMVMESLNLVPAPESDDIKRHLDGLVNKEILTPEQRQLVRVTEIEQFFSCELGKRVLAAAGRKQLWREVPFTMGVPVTELRPGPAGHVPGRETVLLQGVIDCFFVEDGGVVIIDYKTDRLTGAQLDATVDKYRLQLDLYARAVETIPGLPVIEKYLYFFALNRAVAVD